MLVRAYSLILVLGGANLAVAAPPEGEVAPAVAGPIQVEKKDQAKAQSDQSAPPSESTPTPEAEPKPDPNPLPGRGAILKKLSHDEYKQRIAAQEALLEWGQKDLDRGIETLYDVYRNSDNPEVRLRSREVLKRLVIIKQPFEGSGYLGIQMAPDQWKNKAGEVEPAVRITIVREGTAAEVSKLKVNDLVTGVDAVVFKGPLPTRSFSDYIQSKKPGDVITLHVQRGEETLHLKASLRRRSPLLNRLSQWGTQLELPAQSELDESDFQDWLKTRSALERRSSK